MAAGSSAQDSQGTSQAPRPSALESGRTALGKYELIRQLGAGGMGTVYLALDTQLKRTVALKVLHKERTQNETLVRRFDAEARAAAQLTHENIVTVYDAGQIDGHLFIALEFVDGIDVHDLVAKRGLLPLKRSIDFVKQVARALEHINKRGFVHRDIKPSNLLVAKDGVVKLTDMGLARAVDETTDSNITREGTTVGTVDYMAPEQARNSQSADIRSDIYSLGCTWYQMLTGEPPYPTGSVTNKLFSHISKPRPDPRALNKSLPEEVVAVMHRMMARKPADRYQTPADLIQDLDGLGTGTSRLDELFRPDGDEPIASSPTPASSSHAPLPPRLSAYRSMRTPRAMDDTEPASTSPGSARTPPSSARTPLGERRQPPRPSVPPRKGAAISDEPVAVPRRTSGEEESESTVDWTGLTLKAGGALAAISAAIVLVVWLTSAWSNGAARRTPAEVNAGDSPFAAPVDEPHASATDPDAKTGATSPQSATKQAGADKAAAKPSPVQVVVDAPPKTPHGKGADDSSVIGRPSERPHIPQWVATVWDSLHPPAAAGEWTTLTAGRVGKEPANCESLAEAIAKLPPEGGIIDLRGPGPFLLPTQNVNRRGRLIIRAAPQQADSAVRLQAAESAPASAGEPRPLIALVAGSDAPSAVGILATETSLTFEGVDLVAFSDAFPPDGAARLIDVRSANLAVRNCSVTFVGKRSAPTVAFSVSSGAVARPQRPAQVLFDRTFVRGNGLTPIEIDSRQIDMLAINSLFVTGDAPVVRLLPGDGGGSPAASAAPRTLRFFSCTTCSEDSAVSVRAHAESPPATRFHVLNSIFGVVFRPEGPAMIALNNWPTRGSRSEGSATVENFQWQSESFVTRGWPALVSSETGARFGVTDGGAWSRFWGEPDSGFYYQPKPFPPVADCAAAEPAPFQSDIFASLPARAGDTAPPGCEVAALRTPAAPMLRRAEAFTRRPRVPPVLAEGDGAEHVKEIDLDGTRWKDLAKFLNQSNWASGTHFRVRGSGNKECSPIRLAGRSASIEFVDASPPLLIFGSNDRQSGGRSDGSAFISVAGGSIELIRANIRIDPSTRNSAARWLLDVKDGSFAIRDCAIRGQTLDSPGYEGLIHFSASTGTEGIASGGGARDRSTHWGEIRNSFLCTGRTALAGDASRWSLSLENSVLATNGRILDLHLSSGSSSIQTIDVSRCTLSGRDVFHLDVGAAAPPSPLLRVFVDNVVFGPVARADESDALRPRLLGGIAPEMVPRHLDWWEYACAYSHVVDLPGSTKEADAAAIGGANGTPQAGGSAPLSDWAQLCGPSHVIRSIRDPSSVIYPRELPRPKDLAVRDFQLQPLATAATWSDTGKPIGSQLVVLSAPAPTEPPRKAKPVKKAVPNKGSGL